MSKSGLDYRMQKDGVTLSVSRVKGKLFASLPTDLCNIRVLETNTSTGCDIPNDKKNNVRFHSIDTGSDSCTGKANLNVKKRVFHMCTSTYVLQSCTTVIRTMQRYKRTTVRHVLKQRTTVRFLVECVTPPLRT